MVRLGLRSAVCEEGYYKDNQGACQKCDTSCATCNGIGQNACTSCPEEKYLKTNQCIDKTGCTNDHYPDQLSRKCISCGAAVDKGGIADCTACKYNAAVSKPQCTACNNKKVKTALDGTTTCVELASGCQDADHFKDDDNTACILCSDTRGSDPVKNKGIAQCKACTKQKGAAPECSACLDGYFYDGSSSTCKNCAANCATCTSDQIDTCTVCLLGFFLKTDGTTECILCGDTAQGGIDGCAECSGTAGSLKCTKCSPNRKSVGTESTQVTCEEKTCKNLTAYGPIQIQPLECPIATCGASARYTTDRKCSAGAYLLREC